eukprot:TRINITY_DN4026_c0_g2_i2.p2 TRINITY_DN4026_c0_g2~~TRINITY_DN4026_c0_g2_i2.p2  ORF type:complete len:103 (+),score=31.36 TRINITY_DN4026_c0_g2_i2:107-415(+)
MGIKMETKLEGLVGKVVSVLATDGRNFVGTLKSFDQAMNIILSNCSERIFSETQPVVNESMGAYIIRGDHVCVIGEVDLEQDSKVDYEKIRAAPANAIPHTT